MNDKIRLFASDLDGTLVGKPDGTLAFRRTWEALEPENRPLLCYNSGRLLAHTRELLKESDLPRPDYLICGVGTLIYDYQKGEVVKEFSEGLSQGWDLRKVKEVMDRHPDITMQPPGYQNDFKSSWYFQDADPEKINALRHELDQEGLEVNVVYSSSRDLDVLPQYANKGNALEWLLSHLSLTPQQCLVAGDTGNDSSMFLLEGVRGIIVENAQPELLEATVRGKAYTASLPFADGVLEGFIHFRLIQEAADISGETVTHGRYDPKIVRVLKSLPFTTLSKEQHEFIETAHEKALGALRKNITPLGFSACSLSDNTFETTDTNYQSIWARDGAITVMNSLSVDDPDIRQCQRSTLVTLLSHVSDQGQVPSNVRITDESPDYSGVGGISSIDGGLWLIIAFYHYIRETKDYDFLRKWTATIKRIMQWLSAQDSNRDMLLEIPEAGDWMDLFGRSYNVLYDEVLWYYANLCHGRIEELTGAYGQAAYFLRRSQKIKETIKRKFWPSINSESWGQSFADQQFSMGDTSYLLAEITPFNFDWRCDTYANILAGLFNVLDLEKARTAFRFMWGVGINQPWPVANLYPTVNAGDPDWRSYYTVNLMNLPHHYHNGGIWPFIGAYWVQFISRLGLREVAQRELYRLAELNQQGIAHDWEFNEWHHGQTGRPMGKAFQAWSAAGFIQAYHDLKMSEISTDNNRAI